MPNQIACQGCMTILGYPIEADNVYCSVCDTTTPLPPPGVELAELQCIYCHIWLMHVRGAVTVTCPCCRTVNLAPLIEPSPNTISHVRCVHCRTLLMFPAGATVVGCSVCHHIMNIDSGLRRVPAPE